MDGAHAVHIRFCRFVSAIEKRHDAAESALRKEEEELEITARVLGRLASGAPAINGRGSVSNGRVKSGLSIPKNGAKRPSGIPTTRQMISTLLTEAETAGKEGLTGREIVEQIHARWWKGVGWNQALPDALRMVKNNELIRKGPLFAKLPDPLMRELEEKTRATH